MKYIIDTEILEREGIELDKALYLLSDSPAISIEAIKYSQPFQQRVSFHLRNQEIAPRKSNHSHPIIILIQRQSGIIRSCNHRHTMPSIMQPMSHLLYI